MFIKERKSSIDVYGSELACTCGNVIDLSDLKDDIISNLSDINEELEESEEYECSCGRVFNVTMAFGRTVEYDLIDHSIKESLPGIYGNNPFSSNPSIGDNVNIEDGKYTLGNYMYYVENGKVSYIFNAFTSKDQLSLDLAF